MKATDRSGLFILWAVFVFFAVAQVIWLAVDRRPVAEDRHYFAAARIAHTLRGTDVARAYPDYGRNSPYPPMPAYYTAVLLAVAGRNADLAALTLLPFAWLLLWAVWRAGREFFSGGAAAVAAVLVLCFHHFIDVEPLYAPYTFINEYMLDLPLSAMLALALYLLVRVLRGKSTRGEPLALGLVLGMALLIKVSVPLYLLVIMVALVAEGYRDPVAWKRVLLPLVIAAAVAMPWYLLHFRDVFAYLMEHEFNAQLALRDGMPAIGTGRNLMYYLAALRAMLSGPLAVVVVVSMLLISLKRVPGRRFALTGMILAYVMLTMLWGKSWRFMAPCLVFPAFAVAGALDLIGGFRPSRAGTMGLRTGRRVSPRGAASEMRPYCAKRMAVAGLVTAACLRMAIMHGAGADMTVEHGHAVSLAPVTDDWCVERIMSDVVRERDRSLFLRLSVVPCLRRFRHASFMQYALKNDMRMAYEPEWRMRSDTWREELERSEFILTKQGYSGPTRFVPHRRAIEQWVSARIGSSLHLIGEYSLPDGTPARLYGHDRKFTTWRRLPAAPTARATVNFGDSILLTDCAARLSGSNLVMNCEWRALSVPAREYRLFIHVRRGRRNLVAESFAPGNGILPVIDWREGERLAEKYVVPLPPAAPTTGLTVWLGWHRGMRRLPVVTSVYPELRNAVRIAEIDDLQMVEDSE